MYSGVHWVGGGGYRVVTLCNLSLDSKLLLGRKENRTRRPPTKMGERENNFFVAFCNGFKWVGQGHGRFKAKKRWFVFFCFSSSTFYAKLDNIFFTLDFLRSVLPFWFLCRFPDALLRYQKTAGWEWENGKGKKGVKIGIVGENREDIKESNNAAATAGESDNHILPTTAISRELQSGQLFGSCPCFTIEGY